MLSLHPRRVGIRKEDVGQPDNLVALIITSQNTELNLLPIWFWIIGKVSSLKTVVNCLLIWPLFLQGVSLKVQGQTIAISTHLVLQQYKVHIFWEGHKFLRNIHLTFVLCSANQK